MITAVMDAEAINNLCPLGGVALRAERLNLLPGVRPRGDAVFIITTTTTTTARSQRTATQHSQLKRRQVFRQRPHLGRARSRAAPSPAGCSSPAGPRRAAPPPAVEESRAAAPPSGPRRTGSVAEAPRRTRRPAVSGTICQPGHVAALLCSGESFHTTLLA